MNSEKLTAYALNELPPDERAVLEAQMQTDPALRKQAEEIKAFCEMLGKEVAQTAGDTLKPDQRAQLIHAFQSERKIIRPFWRRPTFLSAIGLAAAACIAVMFTLHGLKDDLSPAQKSALGDLDELAQKPQLIVAKAKSEDRAKVTPVTLAMEEKKPAS